MAGLTVAASGAKTYRGRRAQRSLLYRTVQTHFETWLALRGGELNDADPVPTTLSASSVATWSAAFSPTVSPAPIARSADTTS